MDYKIYKLKFKTAVHFGNGMLNSSERILRADTLFSALCLEAEKQGKLGTLYQMAKDGELFLSDMMPYIKDQLLVPKPLLAIEHQGEPSSVEKKRLKKLTYLPVESLEDYLNGHADKIDIQMSELGTAESMTRAAVRGLEETRPYHVGLYYFHSRSGLYFIVGAKENKVWVLLEDLLAGLALVGIGGKRTAGLGRFVFERLELPVVLKERIGKAQEYSVCMTLAAALPQEQEMAAALENATYLLEKRSGFVYSETGINEKKRDLYVCAAGSCFRHRFAGDVYEVGDGSPHPVYRYAKPFFMGVSYGK